MKKFLVIFAVLLSPLGLLLAQVPDTNTVTGITNQAPPTGPDTNYTAVFTTNGLRYDFPSKEYYRADEFSFDIFGSDTLDQHTVNHPSGDRIRHNSTLSAGFGATYFPIRYLGIEGETYSENTAGSTFDDAGGNLIARLPIFDTGLAPYVFGGGGHKFDPISVNYWDAGAGLEFRFTTHLGVFADARYVGVQQINDYYFGRFGFRVNF